MAWRPVLPALALERPASVSLVRTRAFSVFEVTPAPQLEYPCAEVALVRHLVSPEECAAIVEAAEQSGRMEPKKSGTRYCLRAKLNCEARLTKGLWRRFIRVPGALDLCPPSLTTTGDCAGLGDEVRMIRYNGGCGMGFGRHIDHEGRSFSPPGHTRFTFMIYLSDPASYSGGRTRIFDPALPKGHKDEVVAAIKAPLGSAVVFRQSNLRLPHEGEVVAEGRKYLLRADVVYAPKPRTPAENGESVLNGSGDRSSQW